MKCRSMVASSCAYTLVVLGRVLVLSLFFFSVFSSAVWATNTKRSFGIYGFARLDAIYDDARFDHTNFPFLIKKQLNDLKEDDISIHPRLSRIGFLIKDHSLPYGISLLGRIELDFLNGGSESREIPRIRHAYGRLQIKGLFLIFGQTNQLINQLGPSSNGGAGMWDAGNAGDRSPQLRLGYTFTIGKGTLSLAAAAVMPNAVDKKDIDHNGIFDGQDAGVPQMQTRIFFKSALWTHRPLKVGFGGMWAKEHISKKIGGRDSFTSLGAFAELDLPILDTLGVRGEWFTGKDLSDVRGGIKQGVNPIRGIEVRATGFWAEIWGKPLPWLTLSFGYSRDQPNADDLEQGNPSLNHAFWGVAAFRPVPSLKIGLEYLRWTTEYKGDKGYTANRYNIYVTYYFNWTHRY